MSRPVLARVALAAACLACAASAVLALLVVADPPGGTPDRTGPQPAGLAAVVTPEGRQEPATVIGVADAVTFDVRLPGGRDVVRVRALGVQPPGDCYARESTAVARRLLGGQAVGLVADPAGPATDRFDRRLAHAVLDQGDYAVLAAEAGIARAYTAGTSERAVAPVRAAQARAREADRGLWGPPCWGAAATS